MTWLSAPLARMSLRGTLRSRRFFFASLVAVIPLLLGAALIVTDATRNAALDGSSFGSNTSGPISYLILGGTVPFIAMLLAGSIVADDVEDRTMSYILVRPLRRHQVYMSRLVPTAGIVAALAVLQVVAFALLRLLSWSIYGQGTVESVVGDAGPMGTGTVIVMQAGLAVVAAALAAAAFLALFSFVTVLTTRYHFLANILYFVFFDLLFGNIGGQGAGVLTITFQVRSLMEAGGSLSTGYHPAPWWVAVLALVVMSLFWAWIAGRQMGKRDFNVTSAAT
ncbi:MAG: ABC transporter permease [Thermoplasmatota archaeon]